MIVLSIHATSFQDSPFNENIIVPHIRIYMIMYRIGEDQKATPFQLVLCKKQTEVENSTVICPPGGWLFLLYLPHSHPTVYMYTRTHTHIHNRRCI